jgi:hypothetical protein
LLLSETILAIHRSNCKSAACDDRAGALQHWLRTAWG